MCVINIDKSVFDSYELRRAHIEGNIEKATNQILNFVEEDEKIYIVDKSLDGGYGFMQLRYSISPIKTNLLYDKVGAWHKLSEDDIDIAINSNSCVVTPKLQNLENVKINILI